VPREEKGVGSVLNSNVLVWLGYWTNLDTMRPLLQLPASYIHYAHSAIAFAAFSSAFALACKFHYKQVVKNGVAGWPDEWMPSVSAS